MDFDRFKRLLERMEKSNVASLAQLVGCSEQEITALEAKYNLQLPRTYTVFLRVMGHKSGRLFKCQHLEASYSDVFTMTLDHREMCVECRAEDGIPPQDFALPSDGLLIANSLGDQFEFIRCNGQDDSPVFYFNHWRWQIQESHPSIIDWLEGWCEQVERAIANGYFEFWRGLADR